MQSLAGEPRCITAKVLFSVFWETRSSPLWNVASLKVRCHHKTSWLLSWRIHFFPVWLYITQAGAFHWYLCTLLQKVPLNSTQVFFFLFLSLHITRILQSPRLDTNAVLPACCCTCWDWITSQKSRYNSQPLNFWTLSLPHVAFVFTTLAIHFEPFPENNADKWM